MPSAAEPPTPATLDESRRRSIHNAAISQFSTRGFSATSMANIADAAGMSRPALYQYFDNKAHIFRSAFAALLDAAVDRSIAALEQPVSLAEQLEGYLQRYEGDMWERTDTSHHSDEILHAKHEHAAEEVAAILRRRRAALVRHLTGRIGERRPRPRAGSKAAHQQAQKVERWADLLELGPRGFKLDDPSVETLRNRLTALAQAVAADIETSDLP